MNEERFAPSANIGASMGISDSENAESAGVQNSKDFLKIKNARFGNGDILTRASIVNDAVYRHSK